MLTVTVHIAEKWEIESKDRFTNDEIENEFEMENAFILNHKFNVNMYMGYI